MRTEKGSRKPVPSRDLITRVAQLIGEAGVKGMPNAGLGHLDLASEMEVNAALAELVSEGAVVRRREPRLTKRNHLSLQVVWYRAESAPPLRPEIRNAILSILESAGSRGISKGELDSQIDAPEGEMRAALGQLLEARAVEKSRRLRRQRKGGPRRSHQVWRVRGPEKNGAHAEVKTPRRYCLYVIELSEEARAKVARSTPSDLRHLIDASLPCVYVGYTGTTPKERFRKHKEGGITANKTVMQSGVGPIPELVESWPPLPTEDEALAAEVRLASELRAAGYGVYGTHGHRLRLDGRSAS